MASPNVQSTDMSLVLASDAKPRLKWTQELHQRFVDAVNQLGGPDKATPKSLMKIMGIHGLTLYHLKSHLQKYRLGKSQPSRAYNQNKQEDYKENKGNHSTPEVYDEAEKQINESLQIAQALQVQMEVQRKLHEQIEVQRHLQMRIEAQGKYLQSVLNKAQQTLASYSSSSITTELAKSELSQIVSMVDTEYPISSISVSADINRSQMNYSYNTKFPGNGCSLESSLTSSESSGKVEEVQAKEEITNTEKWRRNCAVLSLMEMHPMQENGSNKRSLDTIMDENHVEKPSGKRYQVIENDQQLKDFGFLGTIDLNRKCLNDYDKGAAVLDLNCNGI